MKQTKQPHILIVDDEPDMRNGLAELLEAESYTVTACGSAAEALQKIAAAPFDVVLTDLVMDDCDGIELLTAIKATYPHLPVIMLTGYSTVATAVEAMRKGAFDYLPKPFELDSVRRTVRLALRQSSLERENDFLKRQLKAARPHAEIIGRAPALLEILRTIEQFAASDIPILIEGETGTGKELMALEVHHKSERCDMPFVSVNCAALPETLLESELFGHVRGAFTGATADRDGLFQSAEGGTMFLDEIGDISQAAQARLLRVLQDGEVRRVGENQSRHVNVRIIAATNQSLADQIRDRRFREDLFFRLNGVVLRPPPLRERLEDIPLLADHFLSERRRTSGLSSLELSDDVIAVLLAHAWPGNVRELENVMKHVAVVCREGSVQRTDLPQHLRPNATAGGEQPTGLDVFERRGVLEALIRFKGNISHAAKELGISRPTLRSKIEKFGIDVDQFR